MLKEFREFILRGNVLDLAVGVIIGATFGGIITSLVNDVIMPPIGLALGQVDFKELFILLKQGTTPGPYPTVEAAKAAGAVTLNYGAFINTIINFLIVGFAIFLLIRTANKLYKRAEAPPAPPTKECPYCVSNVPLKATRCPHCTSELEAA